MDQATGLADRSFDDLKEGDKVEALGLESGASLGSVVLEGDVQIADQPMEPGDYECWFVALDLYGNEYTSDVCSYTVDESGNTVATM